VLKKVPLGAFWRKNVSIVGGVCNHRKYVEECLDYLVDHPEEGRCVFTHRAELEEMPEAYDAFVEKKDGMVKCLLVPATSPIRRAVARRVAAPAS
jgi:threonine dehydrogenase-like Zn-dependent dehydrogenase